MANNSSVTSLTLGFRGTKRARARVRSRRPTEPADGRVDRAVAIRDRGAEMVLGVAECYLVLHAIKMNRALRVFALDSFSELVGAGGGRARRRSTSTARFARNAMRAQFRSMRCARSST